jgi:hypothetical protein
VLRQHDGSNDGGRDGDPDEGAEPSLLLHCFPLFHFHTMFPHRPKSHPPKKKTDLNVPIRPITNNLTSLCPFLHQRMTFGHQVLIVGNGAVGKSSMMRR